MDKKSLKIPKR